MRKTEIPIINAKRMVDKARFELATSSLRTKRSTGLIYLPTSGDTAIDSKDIKSSNDGPEGSLSAGLRRPRPLLPDELRQLVHNEHQRQEYHAASDDIE